MKQYLNRTINFIKDEILQLKRFTSPMDGKFVTKYQYDKEIKYMADVDVMFTTIEDCIFSSEEFESEKQGSTLIQDDAQYVEMYNRIIAEGAEPATKTNS